MTPLPGLSTSAIDQLAALMAALRAVRPQIVADLTLAEEAMKAARKKLDTLDQRVQNLSNLVSLFAADTSAPEIPF